MKDLITEEFRIEFSGTETKETEEDMTLNRIGRFGVYLRMSEKVRKQKNA